MKIGLLWAMVIATGINLWCTNPVENKREITVSSIEEILKKRDILLEMASDWVCEVVQYEEKATDWEVIFEWYKCKHDAELQKIPSDYAITVSKFDKKYYWPKGEACNDIEINYWKLDKVSPMIKGNRVLINLKWKETIIDDVNCKTLYNVIEV